MFSVRHKGRTTRLNSAIWRPESFYVFRRRMHLRFSWRRFCVFHVCCVPFMRFALLFSFSLFVHYCTASYRNWRPLPPRPPYNLVKLTPNREERKKTTKTKNQGAAAKDGLTGAHNILSAGIARRISLHISLFIPMRDISYCISFQAQGGTTVRIAERDGHSAPQ